MFVLYVLSKMRLTHPERPLGLLAIILLFTPYLRAALIPCAGRHNFVVNRVEARGTKRLCPDSAVSAIACREVRFRDTTNAYLSIIFVL
jgi:hypothetical protein